jgi:hypothetical protein
MLSGVVRLSGKLAAAIALCPGASALGAPDGSTVSHVVASDGGPSLLAP